MSITRSPNRGFIEPGRKPTNRLIGSGLRACNYGFFDRNISVR